MTTNQYDFLPFAGKFFCYSGIKFDYREELQAKVRALGGENKDSLNNDVSYLISRTIKSDKYKLAEKIKLPILSPEFIELCYRDYKNKDFRLKNLERKASFFPLLGKTFRLNGFSQNKENLLKNIVCSLGGEIIDDTEETVNFLIDDNLYPKEKEKSQLNGTKLNTSEWLNSLAVQRRFILKNCDLNGHVEKMVTNGKDEVFGGHVFKLSMCFSLKEIYELRIKIENLGGTLVSNDSSGFQYFLFKGSTASEGEIKEYSSFHSPQTKMISINWVYGCINHNKKSPEDMFEFRFNEKVLDVSLTEKDLAMKARLLFKETQFWSSFLSITRNKTSYNNQIFQGLYFSFVGLSEKSILTSSKAINSLGGQVVETNDIFSPRIYVLPFGLEPGIDFLNKAEEHATSLVTLSWLECCVEDLKLYNPTSNSLFSPYKKPKTIKGFSSYNFSISGFKQARKMNLGYLICKMGAKVKDGLSSKTTHLICNAFEGQKYITAKKLNIATVTEDWIFQVSENSAISHPVSLNGISSTPNTMSNNLTEDQSNKNRPKEGHASPTLILKDTVLYFSSTLSNKVSEIGFKARQMGAMILSNFDTSKVTHFIHHGLKESSRSKEFNLALQNNIKIVSPSWVSECFNKNTKLCESQFPYTYGTKHCITSGVSETVIQSSKRVIILNNKEPKEPTPDPKGDNEFEIISEKINQLINAAIANPVEKFSNVRKRKNCGLLIEGEDNSTEDDSSMNSLPPPPKTYEIPEVHVPYERDIPSQGFAIINREEVAMRKQLAQGTLKAKKQFSLKPRPSKSFSSSSRGSPRI